MKTLCALVLLMACGWAQADGLTWSVHAGLGVSDRDRIDEPPYEFFKLSFEDERTLRVEAALSATAGWMVRGRYIRTTYDVHAPGGLLVHEDQVANESQLAIFWLPSGAGLVTARLGAGYLALGDDLDVSAEGGMVEAGTRLRALPFLDFDLSVAAAHLWGRQDNEFDRLDLQAAAIFQVGPVELSLNARRFDNHGQGFHDDGAYQFTLNVGATWAQ